MSQKYPVKVIDGKYKNMYGWTYYEKPNEYGNIMVYSNTRKNPYRVCLGAEQVKYLNNEEV